MGWKKVKTIHLNTILGDLEEKISFGNLSFMMPRLTKNAYLWVSRSFSTKKFQFGNPIGIHIFQGNFVLKKLHLTVYWVTIFDKNLEDWSKLENFATIVLINFCHQFIFSFFMQKVIIIDFLCKTVKMGRAFRHIKDVYGLKKWKNR